MVTGTEMPPAPNLQRFLDAQQPIIDAVMGELRAGQKQSHWMWFIFPQITGLGHSPTARFYAIASEAEAKAYLDHPLLGPRLETCCRALLALHNQSAQQILGGIDAIKLRSSMTLFAAVSDNPVFREVLARFYAGEDDLATLRILDQAG